MSLTRFSTCKVKDFIRINTYQHLLFRYICKDFIPKMGDYCCREVIYICFRPTAGTDAIDKWKLVYYT